MPMETEAPAKPEGSLALEYSKLWEASGASGCLRISLCSS